VSSHSTLAIINVYSVMRDRDADGASPSTTLLAVASLVLGLIILGFLALARIRSKRAWSTDTASQSVAVSVVCLTFAACLAVYLAHRHLELRNMRAAFGSKTYEVVTGCVDGFSETVDVHGVATDRFVVSNHPFAVIGGPWPIGYRRTVHDGSPVRPNANVQILTNDGRIIELSLISQACRPGDQHQY
jgi:hypothetical protein